MKQTQWINRVAIWGVILIISISGLWLWDAKDYPIWGVSPLTIRTTAPPPKFNWNVDRSFNSYIAQVQRSFRTSKLVRLRKKWLRNLEFENSYWSIVSHGTYKKPPAIHFRTGGNIEIRSSPEQPNFFNRISAYAHPFQNILNLEFDHGTVSTNFTILPRTENSFSLISSSQSESVEIVKLPDSTYFDSLPKAPNQSPVPH